jgi:hypothetical protein
MTVISAGGASTPARWDAEQVARELIIKYGDDRAVLARAVRSLHFRSHPKLKRREVLTAVRQLTLAIPTGGLPRAARGAPVRHRPPAAAAPPPPPMPAALAAPPLSTICPTCIRDDGQISIVREPQRRTPRLAPAAQQQPQSRPAPVLAAQPVPANPAVDTVARLISDRLSELEAAVPPEPLPGYVRLHAEQYNNARLQFQRRVEIALRDIGGAIDGLSSTDAEQLLGKLNGRQLDLLAVFDSHYQGLKDVYTYDWQYVSGGLNISSIREQLLPNTVAGVIPTLEKKINGVDQLMRLLNSYQNASQIDRSPPLLLKAMAPLLNVVNLPRWLGTPDYPKYISGMADDYLARADRSSKLTLIGKLGPLVQAGVSYPPTISNPSGTTNPLRISGVIQYEDVFGRIAAKAIASLDGDPAAVMQVFETLPDGVLQRISIAAVQPFREINPYSRMEVSVGAHPDSLIRLIKTAAGPSLIGKKGGLGDRGWVVKGAMFTATVQAIDNLVLNKFYSTRAPYANHLIAGGNPAVFDITNAALDLAESAPHYLIAGLRKDEGLEPTGEAWTKFAVYLYDEKLLAALHKGGAGVYPLIDEGGRLYKFWNLLYGNKPGPERVDYSLSGQVADFPARGVDSYKANVTGNIAYATGGLIGSNNTLRLLVEQETALMIQQESVLSIALKELPLGSGKVIGKAIGWMLSPAVKIAIGEDLVQNAAALTENAQRFRTNAAAQAFTLLKRVDPSKNPELLKTVFYKTLYEGTEASPAELWMLRDIMASFNQKMNDASRYGNTFGGSTLDYRPGTDNIRSPGVIPRARKQWDEWLR